MIACLILLFLVGGALGVPIGIWMVIYENAGGGPYCRGIRRANRRAEREYVKSLSPEDREAYEHHKRRKIAYRNLDPYEPYAPGAWDDVIKAPDWPDGNLSLESAWGPPGKWRPPKWRAEKKEAAKTADPDPSEWVMRAR